MSDSAYWGLLVFGVIIALGYSDTLNDLSDEVTSYQAECSLQDNTHRCTASWPAISYRVRPATNEVVSWSDENYFMPPIRLRDCTIFNAETWQCGYRDSIAPLVMFEGIQAQAIAARVASDIEQDYLSRTGLRWWQWYVLRAANTIWGPNVYWPDSLTPEQHSCKWIGPSSNRSTFCIPIKSGDRG